MRFKSKLAIWLWSINPRFYFNKFWSGYIAVHIQPSTYFKYWFINPMNGQSRRLFTFYGLVHKFKPTIAIETGTYYGSSTWLMLGMNVSKTHTIESNKNFAEIATERFPNEIANGSLEIHIGKSQTQMKSILKSIPTSEKVIAYLDAHWEGDIPTSTEVRELNEWGGAWIALVDDFKVETDKSYDYDVYENLAVCINIFDKVKNFSIYFPSDTATRETGAKRGTAYLISKQAHEILGQSALLDLPITLYSEFN
jgi:hypothetical protein